MRKGSAHGHATAARAESTGAAGSRQPWNTSFTGSDSTGTPWWPLPLVAVLLRGGCPGGGPSRWSRFYCAAAAGRWPLPLVAVLLPGGCPGGRSRWSRFLCAIERNTISGVSELVLFDIHGAVATITLNRPSRLNAINLEMRDLLWTYLEAARDTPEVEVIVFKGAGRCFSAGADISEFGTAPSIMDARRSRHERPIWELMLSHRCTTVAAMHGYCYGAGLELPLCCDLRIAAEGSRFSLPEVTLGYIPSAGGTQTFPRRVPPGVAADLILSGESIGTEEALRWRLVERVVPAGELAGAVARRVDEVLALAPSSRPRQRPELVACPPLQA